MRRGYADTKTGQVHYMTEGSGEALLLLHQTPRSSESFFRMLPLLGKQYQTIAIDSPGFGASEPLPQPFTVEDLATTMIGVLDDLGIEKASVFGHHSGAAIAGEMAAGWPDRVQALVLSGFPYMEQDDERRVWLQRARTSLGQPGGLPVVKTEIDGSHLVKLWQRGLTRLWWGLGTPPEEQVDPEDLDSLDVYVIEALRARRGSEPTFTAVFDYDADIRPRQCHGANPLRSGDKPLRAGDLSAL